MCFSTHMLVFTKQIGRAERAAAAPVSDSSRLLILLTTFSRLMQKLGHGHQKEDHRFQEFSRNKRYLLD